MKDNAHNLNREKRNIKASALAATKPASRWAGVFCALLVLGLCGRFAVATTIQDIIDDGGSITIGKYTFSGFAVQGTWAGGNSPMAQFIDIDFEETDGCGVTLNFHGGWNAGPWPSALVTSNISYKVTMAEDYAVEQSDLSIVSSAILGDGYFLMDGCVWDGDPADPDSSIVAEHLLQEGLGNDLLSDSATLDPLSEFYVNTSIFLRTGEEGSIVQITEFAQSFGGIHIVPDPGTLAVIGMGGLGLLWKRHRRRNLVS